MIGKQQTIVGLKNHSMSTIIRNQRRQMDKLAVNVIVVRSSDSYCVLFLNKS